MSVLARLLGKPTDDGLVVEPMRRRHVAEVLPI